MCAKGQDDDLQRLGVESPEGGKEYLSSKKCQGSSMIGSSEGCWVRSQGFNIYALWILV